MAGLGGSSVPAPGLYWRMMQEGVVLTGFSADRFLVTWGNEVVNRTRIQFSFQLLKGQTELCKSLLKL